ncbi:hypothetical protein HDU87_007549 [Geranomyces variabilis]|uniref:F-box domain-containing protein n=1 Tax=Geranomyces variabilis TaxID=109894 RepID=A0AAD5XQB9_9FUNG|nr:hypothetical protein HDU87_007549 [Geranomyces variabilis]
MTWAVSSVLATTSTPITTAATASRQPSSTNIHRRKCPLNPHILYHIFTHRQSPLTPADLASCALVSREWASVATPVLWRCPTWTLAHMGALETALLAGGEHNNGGNADGNAAAARARGLVEGVKSLRLEVSFSGAGWANFDNEEVVWAQFMRDMDVMNGVLGLFGCRLQPLEQLTISLQLHTGQATSSPSQHIAFQTHLDTLFGHLRTIVNPGKLALAYNMSAADVLGKRVLSLPTPLRALAIDGDWAAESDVVKALQDTATSVSELEMRRCAMSDELCAALVRSCGEMLQVLTVRSRTSVEARQRAMDILAGCKTLKMCTWVEA